MILFFDQKTTMISHYLQEIPWQHMNASLVQHNAREKISLSIGVMSWQTNRLNEDIAQILNDNFRNRVFKHVK